MAGSKTFIQRLEESGAFRKDLMNREQLKVLNGLQLKGLRLKEIAAIANPKYSHKVMEILRLSILRRTLTADQIYKYIDPDFDISKIWCVLYAIERGENDAYLTRLCEVLSEDQRRELAHQRKRNLEEGESQLTKWGSYELVRKDRARQRKLSKSC